MKRCPNCNFPNIDSDHSCFKCGSLLAEELANDPLPAPAPPQASTEKHQVPPPKVTQASPSDVPSPKSDSTTTTPSTSLPTSRPASSSQSVTPPPSSATTLKGVIPIIHSESDEFMLKPNPVFDSNTNITDFIHTPTHVTSKASQDLSNDAPSPTASLKGTPTSTSLKNTTATPSAASYNSATGQATAQPPTPDATTTDEAAATVVPFPTTPVPALTTSPPRPGTPARITPKYKSLSRLKIWSRILGILFGLAWIGCGACALLYAPGFLSIGLCIGLTGFGILHFFLGFVVAAVLEWMNDVECNQRKEIELMSHVYHKIN